MKDDFIYLWPGRDLPVGYGLQDLAKAWPGSKVDVSRGRNNRRNGSSGRSFHDYHGDVDWAIGDDEGIPTGVPVWVYLPKLGSMGLGEPEILAIAKGRPRLYKEDGETWQPAISSYVLVRCKGEEG